MKTGPNNQGKTILKCAVNAVMVYYHFSIMLI